MKEGYTEKNEQATFPFFSLFSVVVVKAFFPSFSFLDCEKDIERHILDQLVQFESRGSLQLRHTRQEGSHDQRLVLQLVVVLVVVVACV